MSEDTATAIEMTMADDFPVDKPYVIVVDDSPNFRELFADVAGKAGFACVTEESADGFIEHLGKLTKSRKKLPQFVFFDIQMEDPKAGFRALNRVRGGARGRIREVPAIVLSSSVHPRDVCDAYKGGAALFLKKSRDDDKVRTELESLFDFWKREEVRVCFDH